METKTQTVNHEKLLNADEVAELLSVTRTMVMTMANDGRLPPIRVGQRTFRWKRSAVLAFLDSPQTCSA